MVTDVKYKLIHCTLKIGQIFAPLDRRTIANFATFGSQLCSRFFFFELKYKSSPYDSQVAVKAISKWIHILCGRIWSFETTDFVAERWPFISESYITGVGLHYYRCCIYYDILSCLPSKTINNIKLIIKRT